MSDTPLFPGGQMPLPESRRQRLAVHVMAVAALTISVAYLIWRVAFTLGGDLWLSIPFWLLECSAFVSLVLYVFSLWDLDTGVVPAGVTQTSLRIAVLIPTYNERIEILLPTVAAAVALQPHHETWVLDDGQRPWVRDLAETLGAHYLARAERTHAKAGNLNHALGQLDVDIVAVLDADHVPTDRFLVHTLGYFNDPKVALVQTPQDFYNVNSFEHGDNRSLFWRRRHSGTFNEQRLFYRALQPGKNRWNAAFWCGTSAIIRVQAVRDVGGIAFESVSEDILTTLRLHRGGWRTVFHNEVLAYGLAARDAEEYQTQRLRWGKGAMQLIRAEHPLTGPGLSLRQRLAYASTLLGWFDVWRILGYVTVPLIVMISGQSPIHASVDTFAVVFGVTFVVQRMALALLSRGYAPLGMATLFDFVRMPTNIRATLSFLHRGDLPFRVTPKDGAHERRRNRVPRMLWLLVLGTCLALIWSVCTLAGLTPVTYNARWTDYVAAIWAVINASVIAAAILRIRSDRFAADRRNGVRLKVGFPITIDAESAQLLDVSVGGALVRSFGELGPAGEPHLLTLHLEGGREITLSCCELDRQSAGSNGTLTTVRFDEAQEYELGRLAAELFGGRIPRNATTAGLRRDSRRPKHLAPPRQGRAERILAGVG